MVLVESLARGVSFVQLVFGLCNPRQSANFPLVKPKIRTRIGQNVCPIRGEFAAGERFHQGHGSLHWKMRARRDGGAAHDGRVTGPDAGPRRRPWPQLEPSPVTQHCRLGLKVQNFITKVFESVVVLRKVQ